MNDKAMRIPIEDVRVGSRVREDLGDLRSLAASILELGLLQPIIVDEDNLLIAGVRRYEAIKQYIPAWTEIDARRVSTLADLTLALKMEIAENVQRRNFTPYELVKAGDLIKPFVEKAAREREYAGVANPSETFARVEKGRTVDVIARALGGQVSGRTFEKAERVVHAAADDPAQYGDLLEKLHTDGDVDRVYREYRVREKRIKTVQKQSEFASEALAAGFALPDSLQVITGDFKEVLAEWPSNSVDLIFVDPPYADVHVPLYSALAEVAARILKPGASLLTYVGHRALPDILLRMSPHLRYRWICGVRHTGGNRRLPGVNIYASWKPLLWWVKERRGNSEFLADMIDVNDIEDAVETLVDSSKPSKANHVWEQSVTEATYFIEHLSEPGDMVMDPLCGTGTTMIASWRLGRRSVGVELEEATANAAKRRLLAHIHSRLTPS